MTDADTLRRDTPQGNAGRIDHDRVRAAVRELLIGIGEDPDRAGLLETPDRVARACVELFGGAGEDPRDLITQTFDVDHHELIVVKDIEVVSVCEHHLLPFTGVAHIGYLPTANGRVLGLSKLARIVNCFARRPQVQERLTDQIADLLAEEFGARGVLVVCECSHSCMSMRGVKDRSAVTRTIAGRGELTSGADRAEALTLLMS